MNVGSTVVSPADIPDQRRSMRSVIVHYQVRGRRIHVKADGVAHPVDQRRITRECQQMRSEAERIPSVVGRNATTTLLTVCLTKMQLLGNCESHSARSPTPAPCGHSWRRPAQEFERDLR